MTTPTRPTALRIVHRVLLGVAFAALIFHAVVFAVYAVNLIQFPFDYDQGEGFELVDVVMFGNGQWPYQDTESYPFYSSNYPPLFHIFPLPLYWAFGPGYWYGRLFGTLATVGCALIIGYAVHRESKNPAIAALSALAFLASNTVYHIGPLFRQHMTMVTLEAAAIVVLANAVKDDKWRWGQVAFGLGLIIAAGYTKQLAALTAVAALGFLFLRGPRRAVISGALFTAVGLAIFAWMTIATDGAWWTQAIAANVNEYFPQQTTGLFRLWWRLHMLLIIPAALMALYELYFDRLSAYSVWFVVSLVNGVASGTWGAGDSYFATTIAAQSILSGMFIARTLRGGWHFPDAVYLSRVVLPFRAIARPAVALSAILLPALYIGYAAATLKLPTTGPVFGPIARALNVTPNAPNHIEEKTFYDSAGRLTGGYADIGHLTTQADIDAGWRIVEMMREAEKPVLSEEAGFSLQAGEEVITNPTQLLNLNKNGLYDGGELVAMIEAQAFEFLLLRAQFYPPHVLEAMGRAYTHAEEIRLNGFNYIIMRPNPNWTPPTS